MAPFRHSSRSWESCLPVEEANTITPDSASASWLAKQSVSGRESQRPLGAGGAQGAGIAAIEEEHRLPGDLTQKAAEIVTADGTERRPEGIPVVG